MLRLWLPALGCSGTPADKDPMSEDTAPDSAAQTDTAVEGDDDDDTGVTSPCESLDEDADGVDSCDDCDDSDPLTFPGAIERCDQRDNDCDGDPLPDELLQDCTACDTAGFWSATLGLESDALVEVLYTLTAAQSCTDYSAETTFMFVDLDIDLGEVECVYTGRRVAIIGGEKPDPNDMNTEHSWPQSLGAEEEPAKCDLHHLYPTDSYTNNLRANYPFGVVVTIDTSFDGGSLLGLDGSGDTVFEPRDVHKGNVSRSMLYFAMRYGYPLSDDELSLYKTWSALDPRDERELDRTLRIADRQGVANPYVACPWLVDQL